MAEFLESNGLGKIEVSKIIGKEGSTDFIKMIISGNRGKINIQRYYKKTCAAAKDSNRKNCKRNT